MPAPAKSAPAKPARGLTKTQHIRNLLGHAVRYGHTEDERRLRLELAECTAEAKVRKLIGGTRDLSPDEVRALAALILHGSPTP